MKYIENERRSIYINKDASVNDEEHNKIRIYDCRYSVGIGLKCIRHIISNHSAVVINVIESVWWRFPDCRCDALRPLQFSVEWVHLSKFPFVRIRFKANQTLLDRSVPVLWFSRAVPFVRSSHRGSEICFLVSSISTTDFSIRVLAIPARPRGSTELRCCRSVTLAWARGFILAGGNGSWRTVSRSTSFPWWSACNCDDRWRPVPEHKQLVLFQTRHFMAGH